MSEGLAKHIQMTNATKQNDVDLAWYHVVMTTYGAWLHGDARGCFARGIIVSTSKATTRTRHRRECTKRGRCARGGRSSKRRWNWMSSGARSWVRRLSTNSLRWTLWCCVWRWQANTRMFYCAFREGAARDISGKAKFRVWHRARLAGWRPRLWGRRSRAIRIRDREHQINAYRYILAHAKDGAWTWKWSRGAGDNTILDEAR